MRIENNLNQAACTVGDIADAIGRTREYTKALSAIEELLCPSGRVDGARVDHIDRDELSSLIRVVNTGLCQHLEEVGRAVRVVWSIGSRQSEALEMILREVGASGDVKPMSSDSYLPPELIERVRQARDGLRAETLKQP